MTAAVVLAARVLFGLVFAVAAASKVGSRGGFRTFVASLDGLGRAPVLGWRLVGVAVVLAEGTTAALLVAPATAPWGLAASTGLLAGFAVAIAVSVRQGREVTCRCFGAGGSTLRAGHAMRNGALAALALAASALGFAAGTAPVAVADVPIAAGLGAIGAVIVIRWDDLAFIARRPTVVHQNPTRGG